MFRILSAFGIVIFSSFAFAAETNWRALTLHCNGSYRYNGLEATDDIVFNGQNLMVRHDFKWCQWNGTSCPQNASVVYAKCEIRKDTPQLGSYVKCLSQSPSIPSEIYLYTDPVGLILGKSILGNIDMEIQCRR